MKICYRVFLVFLVIIFALPLHSYASDNQISSANYSMGNLTGTVLFIDKIPVHCVNETFNISGTTSLPAGTRLRVTVYGGSFNPGIPPQRNPWYHGLQKEIRVVSGPQQENTWVYSLNTAGSYPDEYFVMIEPYVGNDVNATAIFILNETCGADDSAAGPKENTSAPGHPNPVMTTGSPTQKSADIPFIMPLIALGSLGIVRLLTRRLGKTKVD